MAGVCLSVAGQVGIGIVSRDPKLPSIPGAGLWRGKRIYLVTRQRSVLSATPAEFLLLESALFP